MSDKTETATKSSQEPTRPDDATTTHANKILDRATQVALLQLNEGPLHRPDFEIESEFGLWPGTLNSWRMARNLEYMASEQSWKAVSGAFADLGQLVNVLYAAADRISDLTLTDDGHRDRLTHDLNSWIVHLGGLAQVAACAAPITPGLLLWGRSQDDSPHD